MIWLNRSIRKVVQSENYTLSKKLFQLFCINRRLKNSDLLANVDIIECIKQNVKIDSSTEASRIVPFGFYSDCGSQDDRFYYWI